MSNALPSNAFEVLDRPGSATLPREPRRTDLHAAVMSVEAALARPVGARPSRWRLDVVEALRSLAAALAAHATATEESGGLLDDAVAARGFARRVRVLRARHRDLARQLARLHERAQAIDDPDEIAAASLRRDARALLRALETHRVAEADLVLEVFNTDLGVGD